MGSEAAEKEVSWREAALFAKPRAEKPRTLLQHLVPSSFENAGEMTTMRTRKLDCVFIKSDFLAGQTWDYRKRMPPQVETDPIPHLLIDIRTPEAIKTNPLPKELTFTALQLPVEEIESALAGILCIQRIVKLLSLD